MKKLVLIFMIAFLGFSCQDEPANNCFDKDLIDFSTGCAAVYDPVCGCDGQTYYNACYAKSSGLKSWGQGECLNN
ncbi:Kazal-type serine protease inhibitor domain-containing protein [Algoriphagus sp. CAU 1675]|uniref:Kazal-type serine protease inhibitor domain-containing protein n=1 Tax=Algoriphagus sp. CAU 1675 TaxID=3032597 RepID=UPI0023DAB33D|nr:Kazal-type serine protease inhibitor domain-containing protein [Algoriphagus sp. CAU 1675]MDF2156646.1 Kazal-type serine protease inhibitor domain-containing protein [Algoriphagus sp. CAU 1675]